MSALESSSNSVCLYTFLSFTHTYLAVLWHLAVTADTVSFVCPDHFPPHTTSSIHVLVSYI